MSNKELQRVTESVSYIGQAISRRSLPARRITSLLFFAPVNVVMTRGITSFIYDVMEQYSSRFARDKS